MCCNFLLYNSVFTNISYPTFHISTHFMKFHQSGLHVSNGSLLIDGRLISPFINPIQSDTYRHCAVPTFNSVPTLADRFVTKLAICELQSWPVIALATLLLGVRVALATLLLRVCVCKPAHTSTGGACLNRATIACI